MSSNRPAAIIVLAAGEGTRMKSATPKVLHELCGRSMVGHVVTAAGELAPERLVVVVGHGREQVTDHLARLDAKVQTAVQHERRGTAHAVRTALHALAAEGGAPTGTVLVTCGDTPLQTSATLGALAERHTTEGNAVTVLTMELPDATGYGRVVREPDGSVAEIVEHKDASTDTLAIREVSSGVFAFDGELLAEALTKVGTDNSQGEEYLPDVLRILRAEGHRVGAELAADPRELVGINNRVQLAQARRLLNDRLVERAMLAGATVVDPASTWIDATVTFEPDALVQPGCQLLGATHVAAFAEVGPGTQLKDCTVGEGALVVHTVADTAVIGTGAKVGPYSYLRPGTLLGTDSKVGGFVEVKNSTLGTGTKVPHLSYVGDATIGEHTNIGASSVVVNYDGEAKHRTTIGSHCRTGADNTFVAPVTVGDGSYTAAGSVITLDVPPGSLGVARGKQRNVAGWVARRRPGSAAAEAAEAALAAAERDQDNA
ncbi:bifunctional UDP-N-acetylglucosamine diphosphorylase/glucosamine-1-phosphate N-acetyltransferase GlmU [Streptomyces profundus]|uniref:bifunctional UDP-N-acetylglucosamine diphosphorylase/glucosamine-1-phosphate N-acetyltransferase GlmU n=1 Tax=Streptomyces profundus TaxID=2867410 RepID=UPI001D15FEF3|nr:bifunctional UDP-N-acetylglucosamine diphosphorylase/glucosamine-1-phosphate N-acetyltransferase GlmU [Streptomyces sp. MA3_2.13]UED85915.1 bifunctional UDP-N-acetylglucosamine diphosphorylase/glucosamine-1-phosphate N-acetyltransferase GlmU [Streptomyces sp. MA3_2.13]